MVPTTVFMLLSHGSTLAVFGIWKNLLRKTVVPRTMFTLLSHGSTLAVWFSGNAINGVWLIGCGMSACCTASTSAY